LASTKAPSDSSISRTAQEAMKLLQNTDKKDHLRVNVSGKKDGDVIHVQSLKM
jgi:tryptophan synthase beta subunit